MKQLPEALVVLKQGGLVCVPTESSYGLAVDAANPEAIEALQDLKGRDSQSPFGLIAGSLAMAQSWTGAWPEQAVDLAQKHWPGPLTLILPPHRKTLPALLGPTGGVALRVSSCEVVQRLAQALGRPITATSANPSGEPPATTTAAARAYFGSQLGCYLEGGTCDRLASTLVDFSGGRAKLLRQGPIELQLE